MKNQSNFQIQKVGAEPVKYEINTEIYLCFLYGKYLPVCDATRLKDKIQVSILVSAKSFATLLEKFRDDNNGCVKGLILWIHREGEGKMAKYVIEAA